ncbi:MAG: hypothetical protein GTO03_16750 [Planctomycetales bacterium]|nr:hypothetical protein [Planctomycetales bacterium]
MSAGHLRVYHGPEDNTVTATRTVAHTVSVPLGRIMPLLAEAAQSKRTWLEDFGDDEVTISEDLYEVILAYQHFRRPTG